MRLFFSLKPNSPHSIVGADELGGLEGYGDIDGEDEVGCDVGTGVGICDGETDRVGNLVGVVE